MIFRMISVGKLTPLMVLNSQNHNSAHFLLKSYIMNCCVCEIINFEDLTNMWRTPYQRCFYTEWELIDRTTFCRNVSRVAI